MIDHVAFGGSTFASGTPIFPFKTLMQFSSSLSNLPISPSAILFVACSTPMICFWLSKMGAQRIDLVTYPEEKSMLLS